MSAAAAIAEFPGRIENLFHNDNTINSNGIYGINMYALGVPHTVIVDDWLAVDIENS